MRLSRKSEILPAPSPVSDRIGFAAVATYPGAIADAEASGS